MILIAGGTGTLGRRVVQLLTARKLAVRILTRDPARAAELVGPGIEVAAGDVRDPGAVARAMVGVRTTISAIQGFSGTGSASLALPQLPCSRIRNRAMRREIR